MKKKILVSVLAAALLMSNGTTAFASEDSYATGYDDTNEQDKDFSNQRPTINRPTPFDDWLLLEPYDLKQGYPQVVQTSPNFYSKTPNPNRKNPVRAVWSSSTGYSYEVNEDWDVADDGSCDLYESDAQGNLVAECSVGADGSIYESAQYEYDAQGRLVSKAEDRNGGRYIERYTYDTQGRLLSNSSGWSDDWSDDTTFTSKYTYDAQGNVLTHTWKDAGGYYLQRTYTRDKHGNVLTYTTKDKWSYSKESHTLTYDEQGRLVNDYVRFSNNTGTVFKEAYAEGKYTYDEQGRLRTYYCDWDTTMNKYPCQYTYDEQGNLVNYTYYNIGEGYMIVNQFTYDEAGNMLSCVAVTKSPDDSLYARSLSVITEYTYDAMGNMLTYNRDYYNGIGESKRRTEGHRNWYTYDELGNLTTYVEATIYEGLMDKEAGRVDAIRIQYFYE